MKNGILLPTLLAFAVLGGLRAFAAETRSNQQKQLFIEGAKLWPVYCAQCHNARPGSQLSPAQWDTITMHMRTQSIMPAKNMRAIREFLKEAR
jgi:mono/diheme cytochrome c family protein